MYEVNLKKSTYHEKLKTIKVKLQTLQLLLILQIGAAFSELLYIDLVGSGLVGGPVTDDLRFVFVVDNFDGALLGDTINLFCILQQHTHRPLFINMIVDFNLFEGGGSVDELGEQLACFL